MEGDGATFQNAQFPRPSISDAERRVPHDMCDEGVAWWDNDVRPPHATLLSGDFGDLVTKAQFHAVVGPLIWGEVFGF